MQQNSDLDKLEWVPDYWKLAQQIGSGKIREAHGLDTERVASGILVTLLTDMGIDITVDELITELQDVSERGLLLGERPGMN